MEEGESQDADSGPLIQVDLPWGAPHQLACLTFLFLTGVTSPIFPAAWNLAWGRVSVCLSHHHLPETPDFLAGLGALSCFLRASPISELNEVAEGERGRRLHANPGLCLSLTLLPHHRPHSLSSDFLSLLLNVNELTFKDPCLQEYGGESPEHLRNGRGLRCDLTNNCLLGFCPEGLVPGPREHEAL